MKRKPILYDCGFNPVRDFEPVVPNLSVNVGEVMVTHVVPSSSDTSPYSKETELSEIGHYITDKISGAIEMMRLNRSMSAASKESSNQSTTKVAE